MTTKVKIAEFKAHLSSYLAKVKRGQEVIVTERETPIAKILPFLEIKEEKLIIKPAQRPLKDLKKLKIPPALPGTDSLKLLLEDREDDLFPE